MPANSAFLQNWLEPLFGRWLYADSPMWTVIGFMGAAIFGSRFILQWLQTEKEKKLVVPWHFWHFSFWGSLLNLLYFLHLDKAPLILGNCFLPFVYGRSIFFLRKDGEKGQGRKVFALVAIMMGAGFVWSAFNGGSGTKRPPNRKVSSEMQNLVTGFRGYVIEYNNPPEGDARAIVRQLLGDNERKIRLFETAPENLSPEGDWLDPWGHPYQIYITGRSILIRSAGKNGEFDDGTTKDNDDFVEERSF